MNDWYVIYCILHNKKDAPKIVSECKEEYFGNEITKVIYLYIIELMQKGLNPDISLIYSKFPQLENAIKHNIEKINIDIKNYDEYIKLLRDKYIQSKIKEFGNNLRAKDHFDESEFADSVNDIIRDFSTANSSNIHYAPEIFDTVVERANSEEEQISKTRYFIDPLDEQTGGLHPSEYTVIAGRPSMGKSGLMAHIALMNAMNKNVTILFSLEMSKEKLGERFICNACNLELWKLKTIKRRSEEEQKKFLETAKILRESPLIIDTSSGADINHIQSVVQQIILKFGKVDLIVIDYLQLMTGRQENDNSRVSALSRGIKGIAVQYNIPVVVGSQLSRLCEQRDDKRPILSDLRDSGSIEQDSDLVLMLYRDAYYTTNPEHERILEILIRKFRNGEIGKIIVDYNLKRQTINPINWNSRLGNIAKKFEYV